MVVATTTLKGQILIPVALRRKYHIHKGSRLAVLDGEGQIILKPMLKNPIDEAMGFLKKYKGKSPLKLLLEERAAERRRDTKRARNG